MMEVDVNGVHLTCSGKVTVYRFGSFSRDKRGE